MAEPSPITTAATTNVTTVNATAATNITAAKVSS
jgi:hypothetical protein